MDWQTIVWLSTTMTATFLAPFVFLFLRNLRRTTHLKSIVEDFSLSDARKHWTGFGATIKGIWNSFPVAVTLKHPRGESQSRMMELRIELDLGQPGRFYLRNRARPMIYDWTQRSMSNWKLPQEIPLANPEDIALIACNADRADVVHRLLTSIASRKLILHNLIDADGELILEAGKLKIVRLIRSNWKLKEPPTQQQIESILKEQWELLRTIAAVLRPHQLQISDRSAAILECPFCKNELDELLSLVKCSGCQTYHHQTCWMEHGRCSVYGCNGFATPVLKTAIPATATESR